MTTWGSREHINALGAFLVYTCKAPIEIAGKLAVDMIEVCEEADEMSRSRPPLPGKTAATR